jgi:ferric-dicitrate binding protein FerR (iron transport regulator)
MSPGERVAFDTIAHTVARTRDTFTTGNFSSWKEGRLTLTDANLSQIVAYIEDNYGKKIILEDRQLGEKKIRGDLLLDNLDDILFVLSKVADIHIVQQQDTILFRRP